jgi:hypothetical protein
MTTPRLALPRRHERARAESEVYTNMRQWVGALAALLSDSVDCRGGGTAGPGRRWANPGQRGPRAWEPRCGSCRAALCGPRSRSLALSRPPAGLSSGTRRVVDGHDQAPRRTRERGVTVRRAEVRPPSTQQAPATSVGGISVHSSPVPAPKRHPRHDHSNPRKD